MAQTRFIKFKDNLVSDDTNASKSGIIPGAVYRGFDKVSNVSGLTFSIDHTITGEVRPDISEIDSDPTGEWVSRQGTTIKESAAISIAIETNNGNTFFRNDFLIGRHHHDVIFTGGVVATYEVIKGPLNQDILPDVNSISGNDWVIFGVLRIPANAADATTTVFTRSRVPSLGLQFPALLEEPNRYTDQQQEFQGVDKAITIATYDGITLRGALVDLTGGNLFKASGGGNIDLMQDRPNGTEIDVYFTVDTTIRPFVTQLTGAHVQAGYSVGLRPIVINYDTGDNLLIKANQIATFRKINKGGAWAGDNKVFADFWKLISVSDTPANIKILNDTISNLTTSVTNALTAITNLTNQVNGLNPPGNLRFVKIYGNPLDLFNTSGRGKPTGIYDKHQLCNGLLDTPDLRDVDILGYSGNIADYTTNNDIIGSNTLLLDENYIPKHKHLMFGDPGSNAELSGTPDEYPTAVKRGTGSNYDYTMSIASTEAYKGRTSPFGKDGGALNAIDLRGKRYYPIILMRLTDEIIAANPYSD